MATATDFFKNIIIIVICAAIFYLLHSYFLTSYFDLGTVSLIREQHFFLGTMTIVVFASSYVTNRISPNHTGFVFIGLLMAKMILSGIFAYKMGWLEENTPMQIKGCFFGFYFLYLIVLLVLSIKIINRLGASN